MTLSVKLSAFEGPLDLLLHLIEKNKIDIYDIPIVEITDQYFACIREMGTEDLDLASEFMVMAATLLDIKCRMLLPKEEEAEEEGDPRDELVSRLVEYKKYKYMAAILREQMEYTGISVARAKELPEGVENYQAPVDLDELLDGVTLDQLHQVYREVLRRQENKRDPIRSRFSRIEKEPVSVEEQMLRLEKKAIRERTLSFRKFLESKTDTETVVVSFLAVLELMHYGKIKIRQDGLFGEIVIESLEDADAIPDEQILIDERKQENEGAVELYGY